MYPPQKIVSIFFRSRFFKAVYLKYYRITIFNITLLPVLTVGLAGRFFFRRNYLEMCGMLAGSTTDPPALAFANTIADSEAPAIAYATVYPLVMFLRIFLAQLMIVAF